MNDSGSDVQQQQQQQSSGGGYSSSSDRSSSHHIGKGRPDISNSAQEYKKAQKVFETWKLDQIFEKCIFNIFSKNDVISFDPYKEIICRFRRIEYLKDITDLLEKISISGLNRLTDVDEIWKLSELGSSGCISVKNLAKIVSTSSIERTNSIYYEVKSALGNLSETMSSQGVNIRFIDVISALNAATKNLAFPRAHKLEVVVEAIAKGKNLDDCLNQFIRRISEEAYNVSENLNIVSAHIKYTLSDTQTHEDTIHVRDIKTRRHQILSTLKAAVMNEGSIYLEFYIFLKRTLPCLNAKAAIYSEVTSGFIKITRRYNFTYVDMNDNSRCFHKFPVESLLSGIFFSAEAAKYYKNTVLSHINRIKDNLGANNKKTLNNRESEEISIVYVSPDAEVRKTMDQIIIEGAIIKLIKKYSQQITIFFNEGDIYNAFELLMLVYSIISPDIITKTYMLKQLSCILASTCGFIRSCWDAVKCLRNAVILITDFFTAAYTRHLTSHSSTGDVEALDEETLKDFTSGIERYNKLSECIMEIKSVILGLIRDLSGSELHGISPFLHSNVTKLFHHGNMANPITKSHHHLHGHVSAASINNRLHILGRVQSCLYNIENTLNIVESSIAADSYLNILELGVIYDRGLTVLSKPKEFYQRPTVLLELINYVRCLSTPDAKFWQVNKFSDNFSFILSNISIKNSDQRSAFAALDQQESKNEEEKVIASAPKKNINFSIDSFRRIEAFTEGYANLCMNHRVFFGGVSLLQNIIQEQVIYSMPTATVVEGSMLRYLVESSLDKAIQECYYLISTENSLVAKLHNHSPFAKICNHLKKFPYILNGYNHISEDGLKDKIFWHAKRNRIGPCGPNYFGICRIICGDMVESEPQLYTKAILNLNWLAKLGAPIDANSILMNSNNPNNYKSSSSNPSALQNTAEDFTNSSNSSNNTIEHNMKIKYLASGLYGLDRILQGLPNPQRVFSTVWSIPPLYSRPIFPPSGVKLSIFSGVSVTSALSMAAVDIWQLKTSSPSFINAKGDKPTSFDPVVGSAPYMNPIELEVVVKCAYEHPVLEPKVRQTFSDAVFDCISNLALSPTIWRMIDLNPSYILSKDKSYSISDIKNDEKTRSLVESLIQKSGCVSMSGFLAFPEQKQQLLHSCIRDIIAYFTVGNISAASVNEQSDGFMSSESPSDPVPAPAGYSGKGGGNADFTILDKTMDDSSRIYADSHIADVIQKLLKESSRAYVPIKIKFTLLAHLPPRLDDEDRMMTRDAQPANSSENKEKQHAILKDEKNYVTIGRDECISRLIGSTLWLSPIACHGIWELGSNSIANIIVHEVKSTWQSALIAKSHINSWNCFIASSMATALLTNQYALLLDLNRAFNSFPAQLNHILNAVDTCKSLCKRSEISVISLSFFGHTLCRHVALALRLAISSPYSIYFQGACYKILIRLQALEKELHIGSYALSASRAYLPSALPQKNVGEEDSFPPPPAQGSGGSGGGAETAYQTVETDLRRYLNVPEIVKFVSDILTEIYYFSNIFQYASSQDAIAAFPMIHQYFGVIHSDTVSAHFKLVDLKFMSTDDAIDFAFKKASVSSSTSSFPVSSKGADYVGQPSEASESVVLKDFLEGNILTQAKESWNLRGGSSYNQILNKLSNLEGIGIEDELAKASLEYEDFDDSSSIGGKTLESVSGSEINDNMSDISSIADSLIGDPSSSNLISNDGKSVRVANALKKMKKAGSLFGRLKGFNKNNDNSNEDNEEFLENNESSPFKAKDAKLKLWSTSKIGGLLKGFKGKKFRDGKEKGDGDGDEGNTDNKSIDENNNNVKPILEAPVVPKAPFSFRNSLLEEQGVEDFSLEEMNGKGETAIPSNVPYSSVDSFGLLKTRGPTNFSTAGFRFPGRSFQVAEQQGSMLGVLRSFNQIPDHSKQSMPVPIGSSSPTRISLSQFDSYAQMQNQKQIRLKKQLEEAAAEKERAELERLDQARSRRLGSSGVSSEKPVSVSGGGGIDIDNSMAVPAVVREGDDDSFTLASDAGNRAIMSSNSSNNSRRGGDRGGSGGVGGENDRIAFIDVGADGQATYSQKNRGGSEDMTQLNSNSSMLQLDLSKITPSGKISNSQQSSLL